MRDLEYLIQLLKFCEKELVPEGVVGATLLEGIDHCVLKCTK